MSDERKLLPVRRNSRWICRRMVRKSSTPSRRASRAAKAKGRTMANPTTIFRRGHARSAAWLVTGSETAGTTSHGGREEANLKDKSKGKDGKDKTSTNTHKKSVKCWTCDAQEEEAELVRCGESGATIIIQLAR